MIPCGILCILLGIITSYHEILTAFGAAFIIAGVVSLYMMVMTYGVVSCLHDRLGEQNVILERIATSMEKMTTTQEDMLKILKSIDKILKEKL